MENDSHGLLKLSLGRKIEKSKEIIGMAFERFPNDKLYVAWTGGKDSTVMLWLYHQACTQLGYPMPSAMFIDDGSVFEEIVEFVDRVSRQWQVTVYIAKNSDVIEKARNVGDKIDVDTLTHQNREEISKMGYQKKSFPFEPESLICNHLLKTVAMNRFLKDNGVLGLSTGLRWDEHKTRDMETFFSPRIDPPHTRVNPILHFTERDIWTTIHDHAIPYCPLYWKGYRSLGAKTSTKRISEIPAWEQDLTNTPERGGRDEQKERIMARLRSLGYM